MRPLVLFGFGSKVSVSGRALEVSDETGKRSYWPHALPFDNLVIDSYTGTISFEALRFLLVHDTPVSCLRWDGSLLGTLLPRGPTNGALKLAQVAAHEDARLRLTAARAILEAKVRATADLSAHFGRLFDLAPPTYDLSPPNGASLTDLRLWEGRNASTYWDFFGRSLSKIWPESGWLSRRSGDESWNRNARDPVNALENYCYALVEVRVRAAINAVGLSPEIGFVHDIAPSKLPLCYDLQEIFRWVADLTVIEVISRGLIDRKRGFITTERFHIRLRPETARALVARLGENLNRKVPLGRRNVTLDTAVQEVVRTFARWLEEPSKPLKLSVPFAADTASLAPTETARWVGNATVAEARAKGIAKTTLWYQRQRLKSGRPLRLYRKTASRLL